MMWQSAPIFRFRILLIMALITISSAGAFYTSKALTAKSDIFYLHYLGYRWFEPDRAQSALESQAKAGVAQEQELLRRGQSAGNYPVSAITHYLGSKLFPNNLTLAIAFGLCAPFVAGLGIVAAGLWRLPETGAPVALGVAVMALVGFLPGPVPTDHLLYHEGIENLFNIVVLVVSPGEAFSPLSIWPKSILALILMVVMASRWSGRTGVGYLLAAATIPFHVTLGGLLLMGLVLMDRALHPSATPVWWSVCGATVALLSLMLSQWRIVAKGGIGLEAVAIIAAVLVSLVFASRFRHLFDGTEKIVESDTIAFVLAAALLTPVAMLLIDWSDADTSLSSPVSIFGQLAARLIVLAITVLILALALRATNWLRQRNAEHAVTVVAGFACLLTAYGAAGSWWWESRFLPARMHDIAVRSEAEPLTAVYYQTLRDLTETEGAER